MITSLSFMITNGILLTVIVAVIFISVVYAFIYVFISIVTTCIIFGSLKISTVTNAIVVSLITMIVSVITMIVFVILIGYLVNDCDWLMLFDSTY